VLQTVDGCAKHRLNIQLSEEQSEFIEQLDPFGKLAAFTTPITAKTEIKTQTLVKTTIAVVENLIFWLNIKLFINFYEFYTLLVDLLINRYLV